MATTTGTPQRDSVRVRTSRSRRRSIGRVRWYTYLLLGLAAAACVFPVYWMFVVSSVGSQAATQLPPRVVPGGNFLDLLKLVFETVPFVRSLVNSFVVASLIAVGQAFLCSLAGSPSPR